MELLLALALETQWSRSAAQFDGARPAPAPVAVQAPAPAPLRLSDLARLMDPQALAVLLAEVERLVGRPVPVQELDRLPVLTPAQLAAASARLAKAEPPEPPVAREALALTGLPKDPPPGAFLKDLGHGLTYGDESAAGLPSAYGDNVALARALNRLADGAVVEYDGREFSSIQDLLEHLRAAGTALEARSARYYANFGDLRFRGRDVATPLFVDTGLTLPGGRRLIVPVTHSHLELTLRGKVNADLTFFFGVDGAAKFRPKATVDQGWVGGRVTARWDGAGAPALAQRAGVVRRELLAKGGQYGPLGVCNDALAFITGETPYPMIRDAALFSGSGPLDRLSQTLPYDAQLRPSKQRVWASRAFDDPRSIPLPEVRDVMLELERWL